MNKINHEDLVVLANVLMLAVQSNNEASKLTVSPAVTAAIGRSTEELSALHSKICGMIDEKNGVWLIADNRMESRLQFGVTHYTDHAEYAAKRSEKEVSAPIRQALLDECSFNRGRAKAYQEILEFIKEE